MNNYYLLGYSGHAYVVADAIYSNNDLILGYFDLLENSTNPFKIEYKGMEKSINELSIDAFYFPSVGSNSVRKKMVELIEEKKLNQAVVKHESAVISKHSLIDSSTFISTNAVINPFAHIQKGCIINTGSIVEHECIIGEFTHIAPGVVLAGNVIIGNSSFIGANSVIIQNKRIGNNVIIGAGSVVISDIPDNQTWVGNPAKRIK